MSTHMCRPGNSATWCVTRQVPMLYIFILSLVISTPVALIQCTISTISFLILGNVHAWGHWNIFQWNSSLWASVFVPFTFICLPLQHPISSCSAIICCLSVVNHHYFKFHVITSPDYIQPPFLKHHYHEQSIYTYHLVTHIWWYYYHLHFINGWIIGHIKLQFVFL